ncbi:MAG: cadherin domain-containing protein [Nitrospira sp.]
MFTRSTAKVRSGKGKRDWKSSPGGLRLSIFSLEQRLMFDAAGVATAAEAQSEHVAQAQAEAAVSSDITHHSLTAAQRESQQLIHALTTNNPAELRTEIIFVDSTISNYQQLLIGINAHREVIVLDSGADGMNQLATALAGKSGIDAIHIISHGNAGQLQLGKAMLNAESMLGQYADQLAIIRQSLAVDADIMVYGCDFAKGEVGQLAVERMAALTGADVAASNDLTGHVSLGADWDLESDTGAIETTSAVTQTAQINWVNILATGNVKDQFANPAYNNNNGTQSWSTNWLEIDAGGSGGALDGDIRVVNSTQLTIDIAALLNLGITLTNSSQLRIDTDHTGNAISRGVDLSGAASASLTFGYTNSLIGADRVEVRVSSDGGTHYQTLSNGTFSNTANTGSGTATLDISSYMSANTRIQFIVTGTGGGARLYVDDVQVTYNINNAPVITSQGGGTTASLTVAENTTNVTTVTSSDADAGQTLTYSIAGGADAAKFTINSTTGQLSFSSAPNYESPTDNGSNNVYDVTVQVSDGYGGIDTQALSINVTNVNEAPSALNLSANTVAENVANGTVVGTVSGTDPDSGDTKAYTLTDTAGGRFAVDSSTGVVTVADGTLLNYEAATSHSVTVRVTDSGGLTYTQSFTINVTNVNEAPSALNLSANTVAENVANGTVVGTVSGTDPDSGDTKAYTLTDTAGGRFAVDSSTGVVTVADGTLLNYEAATSHSVTVRVTDSGGLTYTQSFTINVTNVNEAPSALNLSANTVAENVANGTVVGTVSGTDPDSGDTKAYTLTDTAGGRFAVDSSTGVVTVADGTLLNYEAATSHSVTVRVTDSGGLTYTQSFTINVTNVNEAPSALNLSANTVAENVANGTVVGTVSGTDPDSGDTKAYTLTDTAGGRFAVDSSTGVVTVADGTLLNYEAATSHSVTVRVTDSGGLTYTQSFTINVTNVNEAPSALNLSANTVAENVANGTVVGTVSGTDPDSGDTKAYTLTDTAGGRFAVDSSTGVVTVADGTLLNYEAATSHSVTVRVTDSGGLTYTQSFTINVTNVNEAPSALNLSANTVAENVANGTIVGTVSGTDPDSGDTKAYTLTDTAGGRFAVDSSTGVVTVADGTLLNYEAATSHSVTVRVTDSGGLTYTQSFTINVTNVNEAPSALNLSANTVAENVANGTVVGTVSGTDPDSGDTKAYTLTDTAGGRFAVDSSTGVVTVVDGTLLNYEAATSHSVTVRVTDSGGLTYTQSFTINVANVNEAPSALNLSANTVAENVANGTVVGTVSGTDPDSGDTKAYTLTDTAGGRFAVDSSTGVVTVADGTLLNYEAATSHSVTVRVTDSGGLTYTQSFTINVTNVNEAPSALNLSANTVAENVANGTVVGTVSGTDPDSGDTKAYTLTDTAGGRFAVDSSTGVVTVADGTLLNYEAATSHSVTVRVTDSGGLTYTQSFTINVTNVNEAPTGTDVTIWINEDTMHTLTTTNFGFSDVDVGDSLNTVRIDTLPLAGVLTLSGVDVMANQIITLVDIVAGDLVFTPETDANGLGYASFTFSVQDSNNSYDPQPNTLTINVTAEDDAPVNTVPGSQTVAVDMPLPITGLSIYDADDNLTVVELSVGNGTIGVTLSGTATIAAGANGTSTVTLTGAQADINATLGSLIYEGNPLFTGSDTLTMVAIDSTGATDIDTVAIAVSNNAPSNQLPGPQTIAEDTPLIINGVSVLDADDNLTSVHLSASHGTVAVTLSGATIISSGSNGSGSVTLSGTRADLNTTLASLSYQSIHNYAGSDTLIIMSTDSAGTTDTDSLSITVTTVNDVPTGLNLSANTVAENVANGTVVGTVSGTDPDSGDTKAYTLTDTAGGRFAVDSSTGVVTVADGTLLNYEAATSHSVTVRVTDSGGLTYTQSFTINVTNVNEAPSALNLSANTVAENVANGTVVGTVSGTDPDSGDTKAYTLTDTAGGRFAVDSSTGVVTVADGTLLNYEAATSHSVTVRVTDSGGLTYTQSFTINVTNVNEAPSALNLSANTVAENVANGTVVGTVSGTDPDSGDTKAYTLTDTAGGRFAVDSSTGVVTVADGTLLNYEAATSHSVTVRVTDSGGLTYTQSFTINVTNVNEAPSALNLSANTVAENVANGIVVGTVSGTDPDSGDTKAYTLTDTAGGRFAVDSSTGVVTVADGTLLNYEAATSHSVTVRVTDSGGLTYTQSFTINVTNVNEEAVAINLSGHIVSENAVNGMSVGTASTIDSDAGDTQTYSLIDDANGRFAINSTTGQLIVANNNLIDYESASSHNITVRAMDAGGLSYDQSFTINVTNVNEAPSALNLSANTVAENVANGTIVGTVSGTDPDSGDTKAYTLTDTAGGRFAVDSSTGVVTVADGTLLNYEAATSHSVTVRVTDSGGLTYTQSFTINVTNVNEAPSALNLSANTVAENVANGTIVGTVSGTDPDSGDTKAYTLTDTAGGRFAVDSSTGVVTVADGTLLNYEAATSHSVTVRVTDSGGLTYTQSFTINVTNVNEAPSALNLSANTVAENVANGTVVGTVSGTDPDSGDTKAYTLTDTAGGRFAVDSSTGVVTVVDGTLFELRSGHESQRDGASDRQWRADLYAELHDQCCQYRCARDA